MSVSDKPPDINPSQWEAICHEGSHLLIVAGPGTGKTHTLTCRIAHFVDRLKDSQRVLAITFTYKAAQEMRERLRRRCPEKEDRLWVGTFHGFCLQFLRDHSFLSHLPLDFTIAGSAEIEGLGKRLWPQKTPTQRQEILEAISRWKASYGEKDLPVDVSAYNHLLRDQALLDFDDLLYETHRLLKAQSQPLTQTQASYPFVFVDEYQDINGIQHALLKALVGPGVFLTAIGDPHQSIYSFRGADPRFFESFLDDFPGAAIRYLNENYRSAANLLEASKQIMALRNSSPVPELVARIYTEGHLTVYEAPTDKAEAEYVVHTIEKLIAGTTFFSHDSKRVESHRLSDYSFGDIAVFYRLKVQAELFKEALGRSGIPYHVTGEKPLLEEPGIYEVVMLLRLAQDLSVPSERVERLSETFGEGIHLPAVLLNLKEKLKTLNLVEALEFFLESSAGQHFILDDARRKENLQRLKDLASSSQGSVEVFDHLFLQQPEDSLEGRVEKVSLMTLHASKGLEFPVVLIVGCEENLLPLKRPGLKTDQEEERRLFYVGITRAKQRLYLTWAKRRRLFGQKYENSPSSFLTDIAEKLKVYEQNRHPSSLRKKGQEEQLSLFFGEDPEKGLRI